MSLEQPPKLAVRHAEECLGMGGRRHDQRAVLVQAEGSVCICMTFDLGSMAFDCLALHVADRGDVDEPVRIERRPNLVAPEFTGKRRRRDRARRGDMVAVPIKGIWQEDCRR